ncbi:MAG: leucine-rich repeat domain-containing protein [Treponema sp.]|nr:leucine-rich repeat domain-containing protein [Treponema sp.]
MLLPPAQGAFSGNHLSAVEIGGGVTSVGNGAFFNNNISSVTIPSGVTVLGKRAGKYTCAQGAWTFND